MSNSLAVALAAAIVVATPSADVTAGNDTTIQVATVSGDQVVLTNEGKAVLDDDHGTSRRHVCPRILRPLCG